MNKVTLDGYLVTLEELENKVECFDQKITEILKQAKYNEIVSRLACF